MRLTIQKDPVQEVEVPLGNCIRQGLGDGLANHVAVANELLVRWVRELEPVLRPLKQGDEARCLLEHPGQSITLGVRPELRQDLVSGLRDGAEHTGHLAALVAHRRVREGEPGLLIEAMPVHQERRSSR